MASARIIISAKKQEQWRMPLMIFGLIPIDNLVEQFREVKNLSEARWLILSTKN
jgi:hypothetical protein